MIPHNRVLTTKEDIAAVSRVVASGQLAQGPEVLALEDEFRAYTGRKYAVAVASGTAAVRLALLCRRDCTPCVPAYSCVALANAAYSFSDALAIADVTSDRWTIDPDDLSEMGLAGAAVVAVNTFGVRSEIPSGAALTIEDCTHGFGAHISDIEILSFHPTKLIGGAGGGMILTDVKDYADLCRDRRDYDDRLASGTRLNDKLSDVHAALVREKLKRLPLLLDERWELAYAYLAGLAPLTHSIDLPWVCPDRSWYRFVIDAGPVCRKAALTSRGVQTERPVCWWPHDARPYPVSYRASRFLLSLPLYPGLSKDEVAHVCRSLKETLA